MAAPPHRLHHVTSADGTAIALEQITEGPRPLVTLPGATAGRGVWAEATRPLDGRFAVWLADRRGKGDSGDTEPYAFEREHDDLRAVAASFAGEAVFAAHSSWAVCSWALPPGVCRPRDSSSTSRRGRCRGGPTTPRPSTPWRHGSPRAIRRGRSSSGTSGSSGCRRPRSGA
jgi:hypothetical protein